MGLSSRAIVRRLRAWKVQEPVTRGETMHTATAATEGRLLLAIVKMGGETRPWALMWKIGNGRPQFRSVPEPRTRADIDPVMAEFGKALAIHLRHPAYSDGAMTSADDLGPLRQIWVPNASHIDMFHHLAYAYIRYPTDRDHSESLRLLGRTSLFLFLQAQQTGQQLVMSTSDVLRSAYDFPAQDVRQAHLGFLLAWLRAREASDHGWLAAREAERTPVSTALLPAFERKTLMPLVERFNAARREEDRRAMADLEREVAGWLRPELERRVALVEEAIGVVESDPRPVNSGVSTLITETLKAEWRDYTKREADALHEGKEPFILSPESDFVPTAAAARYFRNQAAADRAAAALVHDDRELEAEAIAAGRAFRGTIVSVVDEGTGKKTIPVLGLEDSTPGPLSLRVGDTVCIVGHPQRTGRVRTIETTNGGGLLLVLEIQNRKTAAPAMPWPHSMHAADQRWTGLAITVIGTSFAEMTEKKASKVWGSGTEPGDWLLARHNPNVEETDTAPEMAQ